MKEAGGVGKGVVFTTMMWFNLHPGHVVASLDKALYDDYLRWWLRTSSKFTWEEVKY